MEIVVIALAAVTAAVGVALVVRAVQLARQFGQTQERIAKLESRVKELSEREVLPTLDAAQSINRRVHRLVPPPPAPGRKPIEQEVDGWVDYLPRLVEIVGKFADAGKTEDRGRNRRTSGEE